ncbi:TPA: tyrosine-type recombinase/integrase [Vibrio parahaemolyticus]|uniref:tyrosine-type recombinase/integrase n=1 Tax=Vibrio alginolyticus TaxID=663 RepID=UPI001A20E49D|nr:site-specific integrase [Vibrio alginolyticus]MDL0442610.1 site-specific integrase [Vibrio alginolyticus]HAS6760362.1 tyrosine-type recombinase/integrase [Vibrio parahaemolyticus]
MTTIQARKGKKRTTYRVQFMRDGQRISKSFSTKKDAEKFAAKMLVDRDFSQALTNQALNNLLLSDVIGEFLDQYSGKDVSIVQRLTFWGQLFGHLPVGKVTRLGIKSELKKLRERCSPATANRYKAALGTIYRYLLEEHEVEYNPVKGIPLFAENNARTRFLDDEELRRLFRACKQSQWERLHLLVLLAVTTGGRRSELIKVCWDNVDLKNRTIYLGVTKNGEQRLLTLTNEVVEELLRFRSSNGYIFPSLKQPETYFKNFDCYWKTALHQANVKDFRFHDLRHTCASILAMNGASLLEICQVLGHKSITMTQRYAHLCIGHKQALTDRVFGRINVGATC